MSHGFTSVGYATRRGSNSLEANLLCPSSTLRETCVRPNHIFSWESTGLLEFGRCCTSYTAAGSRCPRQGRLCVGSVDIVWRHRANIIQPYNLRLLRIDEKCGLTCLYGGVDDIDVWRRLVNRLNLPGRAVGIGRRSGFVFQIRRILGRRYVGHCFTSRKTFR